MLVSIVLNNLVYQQLLQMITSHEKLNLKENNLKHSNAPPIDSTKIGKPVAFIQNTDFQCGVNNVVSITWCQ